MSFYQRQSLSPDVAFSPSPPPPTIDERLAELSALHYSLQAKLEKLDVEYSPIKAEYIATKGKAKGDEYKRLREERQKVNDELGECDKSRAVSDFVAC